MCLRWSLPTGLNGIAFSLHGGRLARNLGRQLRPTAVSVTCGRGGACFLEAANRSTPLYKYNFPPGTQPQHQNKGELLATVVHHLSTRTTLTR